MAEALLSHPTVAVSVSITVRVLLPVASIFVVTTVEMLAKLKGERREAIDVDRIETLPEETERGAEEAGEEPEAEEERAECEDTGARVKEEAEAEEAGVDEAGADEVGADKTGVDEEAGADKELEH